MDRPKPTMGLVAGLVEHGLTLWLAVSSNFTAFDGHGTLRFSGDVLTPLIDSSGLEIVDTA